jgi:hypothetical protein
MFDTHMPVLYFVIHLFVFFTSNLSHHKTSPLIYFYVVHVFVFSTHIEPSRKCVCTSTSFGQQRHYLVLPFEVDDRKYTNKLLDLV